MRAHIHGGPERVKNAPRSRPDTLMQDRSTASRAVIPLATRGRTIHLGHSRRTRPQLADEVVQRGGIALCATSGKWRSCSPRMTGSRAWFTHRRI